MNGARSVLLTFTALTLAAAPADAWADGAKVAVAKVGGPRKTAPKKFAKGLRAGLAAAGVDVVNVAAARAGTPGFLSQAQEVEADFLVIVKLRYSRKKRFASVKMYDVDSGEEIESRRASYRRSSSATSTGKKLGQEFGGIAIEKARPKPIKPVVAAAPPPAPPPPAKTASVEPKPDVAVESGPSLRLGGKDDAIVRFSVGAGTQLGSAYTVAVGGEVTGLAYTLKPLFLMSFGVSGWAPSIGIGGEAWFSFVPVQYQIDVDPPVTPRDPGGRFIDVGGALTYRLELTQIGETGGLFLTPLLGVGYNSMTSQGQGDNTVVVSYSAVDLQVGLRFGVAVTEDLVIDLEGRGGAVLTYSEGPTVTGDSGSGFNMRVGATGRYWINDLFGVYGGFAYTYQRIGMTGTGTRVGFVDDPVLLDATVFNGDFKLFSGVHLAL